MLNKDTLVCLCGSARASFAKGGDLRIHVKKKGLQVNSLELTCLGLYTDSPHTILEGSLVAMQMWKVYICYKMYKLKPDSPLHCRRASVYKSYSPHQNLTDKLAGRYWCMTDISVLAYVLPYICRYENHFFWCVNLMQSKVHKVFYNQ